VSLSAVLFHPLTALIGALSLASTNQPVGEAAPA
jgi:hypothetical protein